MLIYLIGFMGAGKSTLGRKLSRRLGKDFIDLDKAIEEKQKREVHEIFESEGEEYFRNIESEVLRSFTRESDLVIACGGGTPCFNDNMNHMNTMGITVYLEMNAGILVSRLLQSPTRRPLVEGKSEEELRKYVAVTLSERELWYKKAKITINGINPDLTQLSSLLQAQGSYNP